MRNKAYGIVNIRIGTDAELIGTDAVRMPVEEIEIGNKMYEADELNFVRRRDQLLAVWDKRETLPRPVAELLQQHQRLVQSNVPIGREVRRIVALLQRRVASSTELGIPGNTPMTDVLPSLVEMLKGSAPRDEPPVIPDQIPEEEVEIRRRVVKAWKRYAADRGPASARFRRQVQQAYRSTCFVCGLRFPKLGPDTNPGVDAAHILPWCSFDLDVVSNGLCLCKIHHWAFDEDLIVVRFDEECYIVEVPSSAEDAVSEAGVEFDLDELRRYAGAVPEERLPHDRGERPNPRFLEQRNNQVLS